MANTKRAMSILSHVKRDMRESQDVKDALEWFARRLTKNALVRDFARALNTHDPMQRYWEAGDALKRLKRGMVR